MVEKMKLVRVQGTMPQLNEFIGSCCMDGRFDLEPATRYMSESLGYGALNEENPHTAIRDQIDETDTLFASSFQYEWCNSERRYSPG